MKRFLLILTTFMIGVAAVAQVKTFSLNHGFNHDAKVYDDTLFVACDKGLYAYPLKVESGTWKVYAFENRIVYNFVKSGSHLLAVTNENEVAGRKQSLLRSDDYGRTFSDVTPSEALVQEVYDDYDAKIIQLYQRPNDLNGLFIGYPKEPDNSSSVFHSSALMESSDFGLHWEKKNSAPPCNGKMAFSFNDAAHMLVCGLTPNVHCSCPYIIETKDDFQNLTNVPYDIVDDDDQVIYHHPDYSMGATSGIIFHQIVFNPSSSQTLLAATTTGIAKSDDGGKTWMHTLIEMSRGYYIYIGVGKVCYDQTNPQTVYAVRNHDDKGQYGYSLYLSQDGGGSWQKTYTSQVSSNASWIRELLVYNDQLILIAHEDEVLCIDKNDISNPTNPEPDIAYRPMIEDNKEWTMVYMTTRPQEEDLQTFNYKQIKFGSALEVDGMTFKQMVCSNWENGQNGPEDWKEKEEYLGEADGKVYLYNQHFKNTVKIMDFTLQVGDTYRQIQMGDPNDYMDFVVTAVTDTVIATSIDKTQRKCLYLSRPGSTKIDDVWIEGIGSLVGGVYGSLVQLMGGSIPSLRKCQKDGQTLYEAYHPFLKEGKRWNCQEYYSNGWIGEKWTKDVSYVINGTTEIDGKIYYKMYHVTEEGSEYYCALREEDKKVWKYSSDDGEKLLYDFNMSVGDSYMPNEFGYNYQLTDIKTMRFQYDQLLNVLYYDISEHYDVSAPANHIASAPVVEGVGCEIGWNITNLYEPQPTNGIINNEILLSCYEDGKCIFTADDFNNISTSKPDDDIAYRPMIEEGKVWKVGTVPSSPDSPVQIVDYYYFDGDTIIDGKTCKQMWCQRYVNPDYADYSALTQTSSLSKVGAWYEEDKKVYVCREGTQGMQMLYDFSLEANDTLQFLNVDGSSPFIIGPRQTGGIDGFKGVYRDIMMSVSEGQNIHSTFWLEGIGDIDGPTRIPCDPILGDPVPEFLMSCTVGDEVIYLNDEYEDGATPEGMIALKKRFDFTHTTKLQPKAPVKQENSDASISSSEREVARPKVKVPKRSGEEQTVYGEYNALQLGIHLDPLDDAYQVNITNESGKVVYEKTINAGTIVGLSIDISAYAKGYYTVTVENSNELFTGEFETETTGIEVIYNKVETKTDIYNLQGQRLSFLQKGLNIVNGKKVYVK
ncbi:MAG: DUF3244 domain-containing protein [Prevotella sp.]|nr:DUF3244 domain-containing protein [Prevotella sp.]